MTQSKNTTKPKATPKPTEAPKVIEPVTAPAEVRITFDEDNIPTKVRATHDTFHEMSLTEQGDILRRARDTVEKEYLKVVRQYGLEESLSKARHYFGPEDMKKAF